MAKKKKVEHEEEVSIPVEIHVEVQPEKQSDELSAKIESDYEKHPKFSKFKGEK